MDPALQNSPLAERLQKLDAEAAQRFHKLWSAANPYDEVDDSTKQNKLPCHKKSSIRLKSKADEELYKFRRFTATQLLNLRFLEAEIEVLTQKAYDASDAGAKDSTRNEITETYVQELRSLLKEYSMFRSCVLRRSP